MATWLNSIEPYRGDLAAITSALAWAFAIVFFQKAGTRMRSIPLNIFRNSLAFACVLLTVLLADIPLLPELPAKTWWMIIASAVLGITISDVLVIESLKRLGAGMQAVVDCAYTPAILIAAFLMFGEILPTKDLFGGAVVLLAVWVGAKDPQLKESGKPVWSGVVLGVLSHIAVGFAILMLKDIFSQVSLIWLVGIRLLIGNILLIAFCVATGRWRDFKEAAQPGEAFVPLSIATFLGSYVAVFFWAAGFKYTLAGRAAVYNQLSTIFIILLAWLFLREKMTKQRIAAVLLGIGGALIVGQ